MLNLISDLVFKMLSDKVITPIDYSKLGCKQCLNGEVLGFDFTMAFQPIVDLRHQTIFAQEALARGLNGEGAVSVFEQVNKQNLYRFDQTCRVKAIEIASRFDDESLLSINFMPRAIYKPELCIRTTLEAAKVYSIDPKRLIFEFSETERVDDIAHLKRTIEFYKEQGFKTAMDDFGSGYSGLNMLTEFKPDLIKLDIQLIHEIDHSKTRFAIIKSVKTMCDDLGIQIIAEGVETVEEKQTLEGLGIHYQQGFLFAKPAFETLLKTEELNHL